MSIGPTIPGFQKTNVDGAQSVTIGFRDIPRSRTDLDIGPSLYVDIYCGADLPTTFTAEWTPPIPTLATLTIRTILEFFNPQANILYRKVQWPLTSQGVPYTLKVSVGAAGLVYTVAIVPVATFVQDIGPGQCQGDKQ